MSSKLTESEIIEVFDKLQIPINKNSSKKFEVWEVPPIKKGTRIFTETF